MLMNFFDVARSLGRYPLTRRPEQVGDFIVVNLSQPGGRFNYNTSMSALHDVFRGKLNGLEAERICRTTGAPAGRKSNGDAIRIAARYAEEHLSICHRIPFMAVPVGRLSGNRTAYMAIKAPLVRVEGDRVFAVVPGFRMTHRPEAAEIDVAASFALAALEREGYEDIDFEYIYAGAAPSRGRMLQVVHGSERKIYNLDEIDHMLDIYVRGLEIAIDRGVSVKSPNFAGYKVVDPDQPRFV